MTAPATDLACPVCGTELSPAQLFSNAEVQSAFARLAAVSVPLGARVLGYCTLFAPPKTRLTIPKQVKLILQLLPDLERCAITHKGRTWTMPLSAWEQGFDQMQAARAADRLALPMKGHGYLYTILVSLADKAEAVAEVKSEAERRHPVATPVAGQGAANPAGMPADLRAQLASIKQLGIKK